MVCNTLTPILCSLVNVTIDVFRAYQEYDIMRPLPWKRAWQGWSTCVMLFLSNPEVNQRKTIVNSWKRCLENYSMVNKSGFPTVNCGIKWEKFRLFIDIFNILSFLRKHNTFVAVYCTIKIYCISPVMLRSWRANANLLVNPIPKLTIVLIWMTPACLKFGKASNCTVENLPQRKLRAWAANHAHSHQNLITPNFQTSVCFFGNDRSSHYRIRTTLDPISVYYEWASD